MNFSELETKNNLKKTNLESKILNELFQVLNKKEQDIIQKRFALQNKPKHTLEQIGQEYKITRERVRQVEKNALNKLARIADKTIAKQLIELTNNCIQDSSYFATETHLCQLVISQTGGLFINNDNLIKLIFAINPKLNLIKKSKHTYKSWYLNSKLNKKQIDLTCNNSEKLLKQVNTLLEPNELIFNIQKILKESFKVNLSKNSIISILTVSKKISQVAEGYGLTSWRSVVPKSIRDKSIIILKRSKKPLHFTNIAKEISNSGFDKKNVTVQAVHNELIRYKDFVLVGRGIYALKDWGFEEGTVKDVITKILKESGPLNKSQIIQEVLKRRHVKIGTISLNLQKYPEFKRIGRAVYSLA